jgi:ABC-2 type transport system ATP-binding protein
MTNSAGSHEWAPLLGEVVAEGRELCKHFGKTQAVKQLNLQVRAGEICGFLGPNGAGKTTTLKMLVGLLRPTSGSAVIGGYDIQRQPVEAKRLLGYVPDQPNLPEKLSAREFLRLITGLYQLDPTAAVRRGEELLSLFSLEARGDEMIGSYSHGMRQKMALAGALLHSPRVLFLDEPTVGLDPRSARLIKDLLRQLAARGTAVLMSTHVLEIAERMCDRVAIVQAGHIIADGSLEELRGGRQTRSLEDIFLELTGGEEAREIAAALES